MENKETREVRKKPRTKRDIDFERYSKSLYGNKAERRRAVEGLVRIGDSKAVELLTIRLKDEKDSSICEYAAEALGRLRNPKVAELFFHFIEKEVFILRNNLISKLVQASSEGLARIGNDDFKPIVSAFVKNEVSEDDLEIDARGEYGNTALMYFALIGLNNLVELFIDHGADINAKNKNGHTALMMAASLEHNDTVELLLKYGVDVDATDKDGYNAEQHFYEEWDTYTYSTIPHLIEKYRLKRKKELVKQKWSKLENEQKLSSGVKAARDYLAIVKKNRQLKMRVQKCINADEYLQLARSEGYIFTENELNEAKEWQKVFEE